MTRTWILTVAIAVLFGWAVWTSQDSTLRRPAKRQEVVFWHFWGGEERQVVDDIVRRFNQSQPQYRVRAVSMPGTNLDVKLFLSVTGGDPPDVVNQDDPILADWAMRNAILPLSAVATAQEMRALRSWLFPSAWHLCAVDNRPFGLCNGLDVRALFYDAWLLEQKGLQPPQTIAELDRIAVALDEVSVEDGVSAYRRIGFLPNPRNMWAWGVVFGGDFFDERNWQPTADDPPIVRALDWMASYGRRYGTAAATFRQRDQSLPGKPFALLTGRYAMIVDGQWRCRDIARAAAAPPAVPPGKWGGETVTKYAVCPLPHPPDGRQNAGWINGNFFVIPRGAKNPDGAWAFMKFWSGFGGYEADAALTCSQGHWIPVSQRVVDEARFQTFLKQTPLFGQFVTLAASRYQTARPNVPGAAFYDRLIRDAAGEAMFRPNERRPAGVLSRVRRQMQQAVQSHDSDWQRFVRGAAL